MKSAFTAIIGRPSAGKSTLLNTLCGEKVAITSSVPQTTRNKIRGIVNKPEGQIVFIDTPGFHLSDKKMNRHMVDLIRGSLEEVDLVLYVIDGTREPGEEEEKISEIAAPFREKLVICCNKIDHPDSMSSVIRDFVESVLPDVTVCTVSALEGTGTDQLLETLFKKAPAGERMYPEEFYTDQEPTFRISEIIREKAILKVRQEVPHSIFIEMADMEIRSGSTGDGDGDNPGKSSVSPKKEILWIRAFIIVERESQKGIVIGKKGEIIKAIRQESQKEIGRLFPYRVHLDLRVKVQPKWRKQEQLLSKLIY